MYFETPGKGNTEKTLELAAARARELGIKEAVLASSKGDTACRALEILKGLRIIVVTYHCGFKAPFKHVMPESVQRISQFLPLKYAVELLRGLWFGDPWSDYLLATAVLLGVFAVCTALAARFFRWE